MIMKNTHSPHTFHIPVMGTGFTINTSLKVAQYGISSVLSLVDDVLIEQMREYHSKQNNLPFEPVSDRENDFRATRITKYLNLLNDLTKEQSNQIRIAPFEDGTKITKYFEMLPDSDLKSKYKLMLAENNKQEKVRIQKELRQAVSIGSIDVNIMTKLDRDIYHNGKKLPSEFSDASSALRGFANSSLNSSIIFSAGMNRRLYGYIPQFKDFFPNSTGEIKKKIILKVSDFRSAIIQGKFLALKGLWVSEFRIESGLNCGGHAFASQGYLLGPILEEFRIKKDELIENLFKIYTKNLLKKGMDSLDTPPETRVTVQGGIGTAEEQNLLLHHYKVDGTGWGTPFLLAPDVTNLDSEHLQKLIDATDDDVFLSNSSPLGVPFWNLRTSASEQIRRDKLANGKPGSSCPKGFLVSNTEFTKVPICHASRAFQKRKLKEIQNSENITKNIFKQLISNVTNKSCICHDLAGSATLPLGIDSNATPSVCCGPNIVNFSKATSLEEMINHIYGKISLLHNDNRSHMFIKEINLYLDYLKNEMKKTSDGLLDKTTKYFQEFKQNLLSGIEHYYEITEQFNQTQKEKFQKDLDNLLNEIEMLTLKPLQQPS